MSGHSKWHNRVHRKSRQDAKRGVIFSKMGKEILIAARAGGGDPVANQRLRLAVEKAREAGVPADNIRRAIERGVGGGEGTSFDELTYEGYGPSGVAVLVEAQTDNRNRTTGDVRHLFAKHGGNLGETGCVAWMFEKKGVLVIDREDSALTEERVLELALDAGAEDVRTDDEAFVLITAPEAFEDVRARLAGQDLRFAVAELTMEPKSTVSLAGEDVERMARLVELLEELDDVSAVHTNYVTEDAGLSEA